MSDSILAKLDRELWGDVPDTILRAIAAAAPEPLATEAELSELARLDATYTKFSEILDRHGPAQAKECFLQQTAKATGGQQQLLSRDSIDSRFQQTRAGCKKKMLAASAAAHPIADAIIKRFEIHANALADAFEAAERASCEKFGIAWTPSVIVRVLRQAPGACRNRLPKFAGVSLTSPAKMVAFLPPA